MLRLQSILVVALAKYTQCCICEIYSMLRLRSILSFSLELKLALHSSVKQLP